MMLISVMIDPEHQTAKLAVLNILERCRAELGGPKPPVAVTSELLYAINQTSRSFKHRLEMLYKLCRQTTVLNTI